MLMQPRVKHTKETAVEREAFQKRIDSARGTGIGVADQSFEDGVYAVAAPVFDSSGFSSGAVAVLMPVSRLSKEVDALNRAAVLRAAIDITRSFGAEPHPALQKTLERIQRKSKP
jgi:DNA-binding IclR family transcriptional regulator